MSVAVNVSAVQFRQENFGEVIKKVLRETGLPPQHLELELTESLLLTNADLMLAVIQFWANAWHSAPCVRVLTSPGTAPNKSADCFQR